MPKVSKVTRSAPGNANPLQERQDKYYCSRCEGQWKRQKSNFPSSQSPIYKANNGYLTTCKHCVEDMYQHYKIVFGDDKKAVRRICSKFDIYWSEELYNMVNKNSTHSSRISAYIGKQNLFKYVGKTYDDTLDEEELTKGVELPQTVVDESGNEVQVVDDRVPPELIEFWGGGLTPAFYIELDRRWKHWCGDQDPESMDVGESAVIKQICMLEATINRDSAAGRPIDKSVNSLNALLGSANLKPVQKKSDDGSSALESVPLGEWIRRWENTRPLPDVDPTMKDVDGIIRYITIWFLGHLCKMLGMRNVYCKLYEDEIERMRIDHPEYEDDDDESFFNNVFSTGGDDADE